MSKVNYAAIDIGSNAVRLLIKSINPETSEQLFTKELLLRAVSYTHLTLPTT